MIVFAADLVTLSWVAMWTGLCSRHATRAAGAAIIRVLVLPWGLFALLIIFMVLSPVIKTGPSNWSGPQLMTLAWMLIALIVDLFFGVWARQKLLQDFRYVATQRFASKRSPQPL